MTPIHLQDLEDTYEGDAPAPSVQEPERRSVRGNSTDLGGDDDHPWNRLPSGVVRSQSAPGDESGRTIVEAVERGGYGDGGYTGPDAGGEHEPATLGEANAETGTGTGPSGGADADDYDEAEYRDLQGLAKARGLTAHGSRDELVQRLRGSDAERRALDAGGAGEPGDDGAPQTPQEPAGDADGRQASGGPGAPQDAS